IVGAGGAREYAQLGDGDEGGAAARRTIDAYAVPRGGRERKGEGFEVHSVRTGVRRVHGRDHVIPDAVLANLDLQRLEPAAIAELRPFLKHHLGEVLLVREGITDPVLAAGDAVVRVVRKREVIRIDRRGDVVADGVQILAAVTCGSLHQCYHVTE